LPALAKRRYHRAAVRLLLATSMALGLICARARAEGPACAVDDPTCACAEDESCWAFERVYSGPDALLGLRATLSPASFSHATSVDGAALTTFAAERYVTVHEVTGHVAVAGSIGAGSAGTEGALLGELGFGWRPSLSKTSGPILRAGLAGQLTGNDRFSLSSLEPLKLTAGFQALDAGLLVEGGLTTGFLGAGRYVAPGDDRGGDSLARSIEVGSFFVARVAALSLATSFTYLPAALTPRGTALAVTRAGLCGHVDSVAICSDLLYAHGGEPSRLDGAGPASVLYLGLTVGLTP
jgi:hypothetical protein